jgi:hypothetical protein
VENWGWIAALITAFGALIAYLQWITAHQKLVLDLFDKRFDAFQKVADSLAPVYRNGHLTTQEFSDFVRAMERCRFLFGQEVYEYLGTVKKDLNFLTVYTDEVISHRPEPERKELIQKKLDILIRVTGFDPVPKLMPYMRLDQKMKYFWLFDWRNRGGK